MKSTILFISLFTFTCICQPFVYGQIQQREKAPVTPNRQFPKAEKLPPKQEKAPENPGNLPPPKAEKVPPPDLYIKDIKFNVDDNGASVLIANSGPGNAGEFKMVVDLMSDGSVYSTYTKTIEALPSGKERWIKINVAAYGSLEAPVYRADKVRFSLIAPYEASTGNNQKSYVVSRLPITSYKATEIKSEYQIIHVRIENTGETVVKPGTQVTVFLAMQRYEPYPNNRFVYAQCVPISQDTWEIPWHKELCYSAKASVTAQIPPGNSGWAIASFASMGDKFHQIYGKMEEIASRWKYNQWVEKKFRPAIVVKVEGSDSEFSRDLDLNFFKPKLF